MGYSTQNKGYKVWDVNSSTLVVSRDVTFDESSIKRTAVQLPTTENNPSKVVVPRGECETDVENNIDLTTGSHDSTTRANSDHSGNEFVDAKTIMNRSFGDHLASKINPVNGGQQEAKVYLRMRLRFKKFRPPTKWQYPPKIVEG